MNIPMMEQKKQNKKRDPREYELLFSVSDKTKCIIIFAFISFKIQSLTRYKSL
ncbi:unnamed protein product [Brassica rapa subsp. trilocularis]